MSVREELRPGLEQRAGVRRYLSGMVLGLAILQALWIVTVPPFRASDEFDHAYRAAAVARGQWWAPDAPENGRGTLVRVPADLVTAAHDQCANLLYTGEDNCNAVPGSEVDGTVLVGSGAGIYNPLYYFVIGTAARPFHGAAALYAMRVVGALLCLLFLGLGAWALSRGRPHAWASVGFLLSLTPVFIYSTVVGAPNGLEMAAALALWCLLLRAPEADDPATQRRMLALAGVAASVVVTLRTLGPLFVILIVLVTLLFHGRRAWPFIRSHGRFLAVTATLVSLATAAAAAWSVLAGLLNGNPEENITRWSPDTIVLWPLQTIAAFPLRNEAAPAFVYPVVGGLVCLLFYVGVRAARGPQRLALVAALVVALATPLVLTLVSKGGVGVIWQGRYGLPVAVGFVVIAGLVLDGTRPGPRRMALVLGGAGLASATAGSLVRILRDEAGREASMHDGAWHSPPTSLVIAASIIAWAVLVAAVSAAASRSERVEMPSP